MSRTSRYNEYKQSRVPHKKRTIAMRGSGEDDGKLFKCWNCGFTNNIDRNSIGQGEGLTYSVGVIDNDPHYQYGFSIENTGKTGLIGPGTRTNNIGSEAVSGCSFCGSRNYR